MIVLHNASVGADGDINPGLFEIPVSLRRHVNHCRGLSPTNALRFPGDADGAATDANLYEVGPGVRQKAETLAVHHVARADFHAVTVFLADPEKAALLPFGKALGRIHDQYVRASLHQRGNPFLIVPGVDTRAHHIALMLVQQLQRVVLMGVVVLAEHKGHQGPVLRDDGQSIELVVPNQVIGLLQAGALRGEDQFFHGSHKGRYLLFAIHAADAVIPAGDKAQKPAGAATIFRHSHGGMTRFFLQGQHVEKRAVGPQVGIADHKARLVTLYAADHLGLPVDGLGHIDKGHAALPRKGNAHLIPGDGLHHGGNHGDIGGKSGLLSPAEFHKGRYQGHVGGNALRGGVARHQQVLAEGVGGFVKKICHKATSFVVYVGGKRMAQTRQTPKGKLPSDFSCPLQYHVPRKKQREREKSLEKCGDYSRRGTGFAEFYAKRRGKSRVFSKLLNQRRACHSFLRMTVRLKMPSVKYWRE